MALWKRRPSRTIRVVIDANVYASALMNPSSTPAKAVNRVISEEKFQLVISDMILDELKRILHYPKIRVRIKGSNDQLDFWIETLSTIAYVIEPRYSYPVIVEEDPDDDIYVIAAIESRARYLVSGDKHLINLGNYQHIKILTPADFMNATKDKG